MKEPRTARRRLVAKALVCVWAAGVLFFIGWALGKFFGADEPFADLSQRAIPEAQTPSSSEDAGQLRFAVAAIAGAKSTFSTWRQIVRRISRDVGYRGTFILRQSYPDLRRALEQREVDVALVCTGTYAHMSDSGRVKLLVQPEFREGLDYRGLLIVPVGSSATGIEDLRGKVMAFTDPESHTGRMVPTVALAERGWTPESFFKRIVYTGSHDRSIQVVAQGMVDVAGVISLVWESTKREDPSVTKRVRVIWSSEPFGPPPVLVPVGLDEGLEKSLRQAFLALDKDEEGRRLLSAISIRRFVSARPQDYETATELYRRFRELAGEE